MHCPSNAPKSGHYAGGLEDRWTFLSPETLLEFSPILSIYSFRHFPLGEWMTGITHFQLRLGWYLACIISFFPQFSIVKSSIKLDWARLSQPVMEYSGEITLKGTRPWLSGRLAQALTTQLSPLRSPVTSQGAQLDMWAVLWYFTFKSHPVTFWDNFPNKC